MLKLLTNKSLETRFTMKKFKAAAIVAAVSIMLCGCSDNSDSSSDNSISNASQSTSEENSEISNATVEIPTEVTPPTLAITQKEESEPKGTRTKITGLDKYSIFTSQITDYKDKNGESGLYSDDDMSIVICDGFVYLSDPSDICYTSYDNADIYNEDTMSFSGVSETNFQEYVRVSIGDTVNGLTVKSAKSMFIDDDMGLSEMALGKYFKACECTFSGEMELTGYACIIPDDGYGVQAGDILFVPSGSCNLPVMSYNKDSEIGTYHTYYYGNSYGMTWVSQYGQIFLGNANTCSADLSALPTDGTFAKVNILVNNISMSSAVDWQDIIQAEILSVTAV